MRHHSDGLLKSGVVTAEECLRYSLSSGTDVVITGIDSQEILDQSIAIARDFTPMPEADRLALPERTRDAVKTDTWRSSRSRTSTTGPPGTPDG